MTSTLVLVTCSVIIVFILIMLVFNQWLHRRDNKLLQEEEESRRNHDTPLALSNAGEECLFSNCTEKLTCDKSNWTCRRPEGQSCSFTPECQAGLYCSGKCTREVFNRLFKPCPCSHPLSCTFDKDLGEYSCKLKDDQQCKEDKECSSSACFNGKCDSRRALATRCSVDVECASNNCSLNVCQDPGVVSHTKGSTCNVATPNDVAFCNAGLTCYPSSRNGKIGQCLEAPLSLGDPCTSDGSKCSGALSCLSDKDFLTCKDKTSKFSSPSCTCRLPFPDSRRGNDSRICPGDTHWASAKARCLSAVGSSCVASADCLKGNCSGNPVVMLYRIVQVGSKSHLESTVENYAPNNIRPAKLRSYREHMDSQTIIIYLILGKGGSLYYSVPADGETERQSSQISNMIDRLKYSLKWIKVNTAADGYVSDFDCTASGKLFLLADLSSKYGSNFKTCLLTASKPNLEARMSLKASRKFHRISVHNLSENVYLLDRQASTLAVVNAPSYSILTPVLIALPRGVLLVDLFAPSVEKRVKLVGLTDRGVLLSKLKDTSFSYPEGAFGEDWTVRIDSCDVADSKKDGSGSSMNVLAKVQIQRKEHSKTSPVNAIAYLLEGSTWMLPGPGGFDAVSKSVKFESFFHLNEVGEARILYGSSCVSSNRIRGE